MRSTASTTRVALTALTLTALIASIGLRAQQGAGAAPAARPLVPAAASSVALNPDAFYGENVSLMGAVEQMLSRTTFSVDQDRAKSTGREVLIIAPALTASLQPNSYVSIVGEVVKFDPAEVAKRVKDYTLDLPADVVEKFRGRPAIIATSVITAELVDVGKKLPPPMTPAELAFQKTMQTVSPTATSLRAAVEASNVEQTKQGTDVLKKCFTDVQAFFKGRGTTEAAGLAGDALKFVDSIQTAAAGGKWDDAKAAAGSLQQLCATCHAAHRERLEDGSFRVRSSSQ
jgi:hypothetical protein